MGTSLEIRRPGSVVLGVCPVSGRPEPRLHPHSLDSRQQASPRHVQIRQPAADLEPVSVLCQPTITNFGPAEDALDHQERMFDLRPNLRLRAVPGPLRLAQRAMAMGFGLDETLGLGRVLPNDVALPAVGRIAPHPRLLAMQQMGQRLAIMHVGRLGPQDDTCRLQIERSLRYLRLSDWGFARSPGGWDDRHRRCRVSCAAMQRPEVAC